MGALRKWSPIFIGQRRQAARHNLNFTTEVGIARHAPTVDRQMAPINPHLSPNDYRRDSHIKMRHENGS